MRVCAQTFESELGVDALETLKVVLQEDLREGLHVEIGTAAGGTLKELLRLYADEPVKPNFLVIDPMTYFPEQLKIVKDNISTVSYPDERVEFMISKGGEAFDKFRLGDVCPISFLLIDGSHKIKYVTQDAQWLDFVEIGGVVCFDDYQAGFQGVDWVVDQVVNSSKCFERIAYAGRLLILRKIADKQTPIVMRRHMVMAALLHPFLQIVQSLRKRLRN